jgi:mannose-1-phosphate guanylyltransferase
MQMSGSVWVIILAAGDGTRVRTLTRGVGGVPVPKQFYAAGGGCSLLRRTVKRAVRIASKDHIVPVVAADHSQWWRSELIDIPRKNIVVQPQNKGTAAGLLISALHILRQDPGITCLVVLPSDHYVRNEAVLHEGIQAAILASERNEDRIVLLGAQAQNDDLDYGWIVPCNRTTTMQSSNVAAFVEKPDPQAGEMLRQRGALINSFILASSARALWQQYLKTAPQLLHRLARCLAKDQHQWNALCTLYDSLPALDFSRNILEPAPARLSVVPIPACGWVDLGTPERLVRHLTERNRSHPPLPPSRISARL